MQVIRDINSRYWQECTGFHTLLLVYTGYWPLLPDETSRLLKMMKWIPVTTSLGLIFSMIVAIYDFTFKLHDYMLLAESLSYMITLLKAIVISLIHLFKMEDIVRLFSNLEYFTSCVVDNEERKIFEKCKLKTRSYTITVLLAWVVYSLVFTVKPLFEAERRYPMHFNLPLDPSLYPFWYCCTVVSGVASTVVIASFDGFVVASFIYFSGYLEILQFKLEHVREMSIKEVLKVMTRIPSALTGESLRGSATNDDMIVNVVLENVDHPDYSASQVADIRENVRKQEMVLTISTIMNTLKEYSDVNVQSLEEELSEVVVNTDADEGLTTTPEMEPNVDMRALDVEMRRHLGECVKFHKILMRYIDDIQERANLVLFTELILGAVAICLTMFLMTVVPVGSFDMYMWFGYMFLALEELYGVCWASSQLHEESVQVSDALYFSDWTEASPSYKRSMLIMMSRAVRPLEISTMNFLTFDMDMFSNVVNSAYSYFNVMTEMNKSK